MQSVALNLSAFARISQRQHDQTSRTVHVNCGPDNNAIRRALPVLYMTSCYAEFKSMPAGFYNGSLIAIGWWPAACGIKAEDDGLCV